MSDFTDGSSAYGLEFNEFSELPTATKKKIVRMMARVAERSYRRGAHHACDDDADLGCIKDVWSWRFKTSLDRAVGIDGNEMPSLDRLETEEPIRTVGLL